MAELQETWLYLFVFLGLFGLVCAVTAAVYWAHGGVSDNANSGAPEGWWRR